MSRTTQVLIVAFVIVLVAACAAILRPTLMPGDALLAELWQPPNDLAARDLHYGPGSAFITGVESGFVRFGYARFITRLREKAADRLRVAEPLSVLTWRAR